MAKARSVYEDLKPFLTLINVYGVNWKSERHTGWRILKLTTCVIWSTLYTSFTIFCLVVFFEDLNRFRMANLQHKTSNVNILMVLLAINAISFIVCVIYRKRLAMLATFLGKESGQNVGRWRKVVKQVSLYLYSIIPLFFITPWIISLIMRSNESLSTRKPIIGDPVQTMWFLVHLAMVTVAVFSLGFFFAPSFLVCCLVYYVSATCEDSLNQLKECTSPTRRARLSACVLKKYAQVGEMTSVADPIGAIIMYVLKMATVTVFLSAAYNFGYFKGGDEEGAMAANVMIMLCLAFGSTCLVIYCGYISLAHSANNQVRYLLKALAEVWPTDDLSTDPHSRLHLLRRRVDQLIVLTHLMIDRPAFTLLGEQVDGENLFTLCAEIGDNLSSAYLR